VAAGYSSEADHVLHKRHARSSATAVAEVALIKCLQDLKLT
jgi:hypothetical protein